MDKVTSLVKSDHSYNLFQEIDGSLPQDKELFKGVLRKFINLEPKQRVCFQLGKRLGYLLKIDDLEDLDRLANVENICRHAEITPENVDKQINALIQQWMREGMW